MIDSDEPIDEENEGTAAGLSAPFPYFGGKSRCADTVWQLFGDVRNYVEPWAWG